jgi:hypothetical protein
MTNGNTGLHLVGLMGDNPLAFLASVGALRILSRIWPDREVRLAWRARGSWNPWLQVNGACTEEEVVAALASALAGHHLAPEFNDLGADLPVAAPAFVALARRAVAQATPSDRATADYCAAYGSEAYAGDNLIGDTGLRTMSGAGHQHFLEFMREILRTTTPEDIRSAFFATWTYSDPRPSMRWDPQDDRRYALRASDPAGGQSPITTVRGANALAIEALPCFPTAPANREVKTRAFHYAGSVFTFCWPIWDTPITLACLTSLLGHAEITEEHPGQAILRPLGVVEVFRARRLTVGRYRSFTAGVPCWGCLPTKSIALALPQA